MYATSWDSSSFSPQSCLIALSQPCLLKITAHLGATDSAREASQCICQATWSNNPSSIPKDSDSGFYKDSQGRAFSCRNITGTKKPVPRFEDLYIAHSYYHALESFPPNCYSLPHPGSFLGWISWWQKNCNGKKTISGLGALRLGFFLMDLISSSIVKPFVRQ